MGKRQQERAGERALEKQERAKQNVSQSKTQVPAEVSSVVEMPPSPHFEKLRFIRGWFNSMNALRTVKRHEKGGRDVFEVPSERFADVLYSAFVDQDGCWLCTCEDFRACVKPCKHIIEVLFRFFPGSAPSPPSEEELAPFEKEQYKDARRFPKETPARKEGLPAASTRYDHALEEADQRTETLLLDLAALINSRWPEVAAPNRHTLPPGDKVLVRVLRVQHRKSIRRFSAIGGRLERENKIAFYPCRASQIKYDGSEAVLTNLQRAFNFTAGVFALMDEDIIIDSSGLSPFYVSCWRSSEYGTTNIRAGTQWFKMHVAVGSKSLAILGFIVTLHAGPESADIHNFKPLLDGLAAHGFSPRFVIADNIYLTDGNIAAAKAVGTTLVGPLKPRNYRRDGTPSPAILPVARFKGEHPELYDVLCRARSVIESVFSVEVRVDRHIASTGSKAEREAVRIGEADILFVSRRSEFWARAIDYNLNRTVVIEHDRNMRMYYTRGTVFGYLPRTPGIEGEIYGTGA